MPSSIFVSRHSSPSAPSGECPRENLSYALPAIFSPEKLQYFYANIVLSLLTASRKHCGTFVHARPSPTLTLFFAIEERDGREKPALLVLTSTIALSPFLQWLWVRGVPNVRKMNTSMFFSNLLDFQSVTALSFRHTRTRYLVHHHPFHSFSPQARPGAAKS